MPTPAAIDPMRRLLEQSLLAWRVLGRVEPRDGGIRIEGLGRLIEIRRAETGLPFRWMVTIAGRQRPALAIPAVLRQVRGALDPQYQTARLRIAREPAMITGGASDQRTE